MRRKLKLFRKNTSHNRYRILDKDFVVLQFPDREIEGGEEYMLDRETILKAIDGDPDCLDKVVAHYEPVIDKYSRRRKISRSGVVRYKIDPDVKRYLQLCLRVAVMNYKVR